MPTISSRLRQRVLLRASAAAWVFAIMLLADPMYDHGLNANKSNIHDNETSVTRISHDRYSKKPLLLA